MLTASSCTPYGTAVTLTRQSEVDSFPINYPSCDVVEGYLTISGNDITNLNGLLGVKRVNIFTIVNNVNLTNLRGLDSIKFINIFEVNNNDKLFNLIGLGNVDTILSNFTIENNDQLLDFTGMDNFSVIIDQFIVENNALLKNFFGLKRINHIYGFKVLGNPSLVDLTGLETIRYMNYFDIDNNTSLINLKGLEGLIQLDQHCWITNNSSLQNFIGLDNVIKFNSSFFVSQNPKIVNCYGLEKVRFIGSLTFDYNEKLLNFQGLNRLDSVYYFEVNYNLSLNNFDGLQNLKYVGGVFFNITNNNRLCSINELNPLLNLNNSHVGIQFNPKLSCCRIMDTILKNNQNLLDVIVLNNASGCNDTTEIRTMTTQTCCSTKYSSLKDTICNGNQFIFNNKILTVAGIYHDTITVGNVDSIIVFQLTVRPKFYQIITKNLCIGQSFTLSNGKVITTNGIYKDTIPNVCDSIIEYRLTFLNNITTSVNASICKGKTYTLPKVNVVSIAGIYKDTLLASFGCDSIIITNLTITNPVANNINVSICDGQTYTLPNGRQVSTTGVYTDTIRKSNTCDSVVVTNLNVFPNTFNISLNTIDTIDAGNSIELKPLYANPNAVSWSWSPSANLSCNTCENPIASPIQTTQYVLNAKSIDGCEDTASTTIAVRQLEVYIPTAFSPNHDGINDNLEVFATNPKSFSLKIYNRYGELVFQSNDINIKWNGTYKGENCEVDNYNFVMDATQQNGKQIHQQGVILLVR